MHETTATGESKATVLVDEPVKVARVKTEFEREMEEVNSLQRERLRHAQEQFNASDAAMRVELTRVWPLYSRVRFRYNCNQINPSEGTVTGYEGTHLWIEPEKPKKPKMIHWSYCFM